MAEISIVNTGENSPEQVAYQLMKDIQASGAAFKLNADQFPDLYAECLRAVRTPEGRHETHEKMQARSGFEV
jgi:hypothetical protein